MGDINAECLSDLRADENCISTWFVGDRSNKDVEKAVAALASGFKALDEISIVFIDEEEIKAEGLSVVNSEGATRVEEYKMLHRDIDALDIKKLSVLAHVILKSIWNNNVKAINAEELSLILLDLIVDGKLELQALDKNFRKSFSAKIKKVINKKKINWDAIPANIKIAFDEQWELNKLRTNCKYEKKCDFYKP